MVRCGPGDAERLLGIGRIAGVERWDVRAGAPDHLNTSQGSIFAPSLQHLSQRELEEGFARVGDRSVCRPPGSPKVHILTFPSSEPPTHVRAAYLFFDVRPILPKPMRRQKFSHRHQHCRASSPTCTLCAQPGHDLNSCPSDSLLCASCDGPHASDDTGCPRWIEESRLALMMRRGWDRWDAKTYIQHHPSSDIDAPFPLLPPTPTSLLPRR